MSTPIAQVIEAAGGITKLAGALGIRHTAIYSWKQVPAERVLKVEEVTGISRHALRPDVYGVQPEAAE